jgi:hypothetical protein
MFFSIILSFYTKNQKKEKGRVKHTTFFIRVIGGQTTVAPQHPK